MQDEQSWGTEALSGPASPMHPSQLDSELDFYSRPEIGVHGSRVGAKGSYSQTTQALRRAGPLSQRKRGVLQQEEREEMVGRQNRHVRAAVSPGMCLLRSPASNVLFPFLVFI